MASLPIFPQVAGLNWGCTKKQKWQTYTQKSASRKIKSMSNCSLPIWNLTAVYNKSADVDIDTVIGFVIRMSGALKTFLWYDDRDNTCTGVVIGTGSGVAGQQVELLRKWGTQALEPVKDVKQGTLKIYADGVLITGYTNDDGIITFTTPVASGAVISWSGQYYWRVRIVDDGMSYKDIWFDCYELGKIEMETVI